MTGEQHSLDNKAPLEPVWPIPQVYLLHGKGGSPDGTVRKLHAILEQHWPGLEFLRPELPHSDPSVPAEISVEYLMQMRIPHGALMIGVSLGGTVAAKLQEAGRGDLKVIALSSPTWADEVVLNQLADRRLAFYSSKDNVIASRVAEWPNLASFARDLEWLTHDTDRHLHYIARLFDWYLEERIVQRIDQIRDESYTRQELDDIVWRSMAEAGRDRKPSRKASSSGEGWPQNFAEIGRAMQSGADWEDAWSGWSHRFMFTKDPECLAAEPPVWFPPERRAMLAGAAEFLARLYGLPTPPWVEKAEYFSPETNYYGCVISFGEESVLLMPESEPADYRLRARTPKEMLRRNVIFEARNLTVL